MSIYQTRVKQTISADRGSDRVTQSGSPQRLLIATDGQDFGQIWAHKRKATPPSNLLPVSAKWLLSLPRGVRPLSLAARYPRIANVLALQWTKPAAARACFSDLLSDRRGNRKGFPEHVHRELKVLRDYHYELRPEDLHLSIVE